MGITESCSKDRSEGDTDLEGYSQHRDDRGRGVILYIDNKLQSTPCVELNGTDFESSVWNIITLNKKDKLLVGCIKNYINVLAQLNIIQIYSLRC